MRARCERPQTTQSALRHGSHYVPRISEAPRQMIVTSLRLGSSTWRGWIPRAVARASRQHEPDRISDRAQGEWTAPECLGCVVTDERANDTCRVPPSSSLRTSGCFCLASPCSRTWPIGAVRLCRRRPRAATSRPIPTRRTAPIGHVREHGFAKQKHPLVRRELDGGTRQVSVCSFVGHYTSEALRGGPLSLRSIGDPVRLMLPGRPCNRARNPPSPG